nr:sulfatase-like hydrolase/transferase [uncultured Psychroserpens sp.]
MFILLSISGGVFHNIYEIFKLNNVSDKSLDIALKELNINPNDYVYSTDVEAKKGKNIIVISLESYEKGLLSDKLKDLTPNLRKLKEKHSFFDMNQGFASDWTSGSMYTYLTGIPMIFKGHGNNTFQNSINAEITGISHVLDKAGYEQLYLIGNPDFAGINDLLKTYGIQNFPQSYYDKKYGKSSFGLHDFDLFAEAKEQVLKFKTKNKPFALYLSTISTHFPDGKYDARMEKNISKKDSNLEFMVASVDYMVNNFINFLENEDLLENTVFYIFPDHLFMGRSSNVLNEIEERKLFLLTNAIKERLKSVKGANTIEQIDLAKIILDGAEIKHNVKFLSDYILGDKKDFVEKNKEKLLALNEASIRVDGFDEDFEITLKSFSKAFHSNTLKLISKHKPLSFETDTFAIKNNRYHAFVFDESMRVSHRQSNNKRILKNTFGNKINMIIDIVDSTKINMFIRKGTVISKVKQYFQNNIEVLKDDIDDLKLIEQYGLDNPTTLNNKYFKINNPGGTLYLTSSSSNRGILKPIPSSDYTAISLNDKKLNHKRGLNLVLLDNPNKIEVYSIHDSENEIRKFILRVKRLIKNGIDFVIVAHNPVQIKSKEFRNELMKFGLVKLAKIDENMSYICYSEKGISLERIEPNAISIQVNMDNNQVDKKSFALKKQETSRYIAHAGGEIDGFTYTNSLEALDYNYKKGFRLFELDILKTADNKFVAAHDWKRWKENNGFEEKDSITHETFMKIKMHNKYSALSMNEINSWFKTHNDAILVTDKINSPKEFADKFVDKSRLMMELFSNKAVDEAIKNKVTFLAAPSVFKNMNYYEKLDYVKKKNIKYMSVSRKTINHNKVLYRNLRNSGVKIFAYHISFEKWKDEKYVFLNEMDFIYGIYADRWFEE